ncbi:hypothetical protein [Sulfurisphaera ohwakuensis]|uniref:Uncharacterized protein n=1 Tax=Sulfurisphaera ohwakuensis TaxID=69656 RepID=A0A650CG84_SULOH|nr:hypothetical protein [Sulfurisphaera ohwakuensis]MBB5254947.1 hypothetical protein [Sulfurisphaera ohwakuensis]QGR16758.1 hypothetical protein D1869_05820 [Sulfurisphaera ohwakuensis]
MSKKDIPIKLPIIDEHLSVSPVKLTQYETEIMLRCKICNQLVPASGALEHQLFHKNKGEDACFTVEAPSIKGERRNSSPTEIM